MNLFTARSENRYSGSMMVLLFTGDIRHALLTNSSRTVMAKQEGHNRYCRHQPSISKNITTTYKGMTLEQLHNLLCYLSKYLFLKVLLRQSNICTYNIVCVWVGEPWRQSLQKPMSKLCPFCLLLPWVCKKKISQFVVRITSSGHKPATNWHNFDACNVVAF